MRQRDQKKNPAPKAFGAEFWRRPIDSFAPAHSPATLAGLTVYPPASQHGVFSARVGVPEIKNPTGMNRAGFYSGDVLLSHDLSSHYHRGCSVSLPCSEWERVVPLRYYHQSPMPDWLSPLSRRGKPMPPSEDCV